MPANMLEEFKVKKGGDVTIALKGLSTAGYEWNYTVDGDESCIKISKEFDLPEKASGENLGSSADEIFTISAEKTGTVNIHFTQQRNWEKNAEPANEKKLKLLLNR